MAGLKINSNYHIELQARWARNYDVKIEGTVSPSALQELSPITDLKKEFFDDYGLSISMYLLLLSKSTVVYICRAITSFDPYEINNNDNDRIFIPESLIDTVRTYEYVLAKRYIFEVSTGVKKFKNILEEDQFFKDMRKKISEKMKSIDDFIADNISTDVSGVEVIVTNEYLIKLENLRNELIDDYKIFALQKRNSYEDDQRHLYEQIQKTKEAEIRYEEQRRLLNSHLEDLSNQIAQNTHINNILLGSKDVMMEMMNKLKSGQILPDDMPTFDELYDQVEKEINS
jgi:hypothetical protein